MEAYSGHGDDLGFKWFMRMMELSNSTFDGSYAHNNYSHLLAVVANTESGVGEVLELSRRVLGPEDLYPLMGLEPDREGLLSVYDPKITGILREGIRTGDDTTDIDNSLIVDPEGHILPGTFYIGFDMHEVDDLSGTGRAAMEWISRKVEGVTSVHKRTDGHVLAFENGVRRMEAYYDRERGNRMHLRSYDENGAETETIPVKFGKGNVVYLTLDTEDVIRPIEEPEAARA
jgi:hypothetical protein